ncbi:pilus assembly PilX N-terminal domain-containing protein [Shewanella sp. AS16]|uniref:pilus assembly PilX family protein n=1 Tax=Shewanella sp. AS16 TaxID=2907625 RepID=UPI001F2EBC65|nr:pilus assembly PilX N-terminal domain-containing protein [Shewanella sp. AS16]MCE9685278.1 pilus assembly PilX N-terminal domain-containing protein [Shewanella sp. AS16]
MNKQKGVVLFFSLIVLIIMTLIGVALAVNSLQSMRMSGAGSERIEAGIAANGALDAAIASNQGAGLANMSTTTQSSLLNGTQTITPLPEDGTVQDVSCQRSTNASAANLIACRRLEISSSSTFGRDDLGQLTVVAGIEQEVLRI